MGARALEEIVREDVIARIKSQIGAALVEVRVARNNLVQSHLPQEYKITEAERAQKLPAVYVLLPTFTANKAKGANHTNGTMTMNVICIVDSSTADRVLIKSERYGAALDKILDQATIDDVANGIKLTIIRDSREFSPTYRVSKNSGRFRREVMLGCRVEYYENFNFLT